MKEDKLSDIFADYQPELSSDVQFMERLSKNMDSMELLKEHTTELRRKNKIAVAVAGITGFILAVAGIAVYPVIAQLFGDVAVMAIKSLAVGTIRTYTDVLSLAIISGAVVFAVYMVYDLTQRLCKSSTAA